VPFVNNYGVWMDEIRELGMEHCLECSWPDALCYCGERETRVGRGYGRVSRRLFRQHLLKLCKEAGVGFLSAEVSDIDAPAAGKTCVLTCSDGNKITSRCAAGRQAQQGAAGADRS
jgi:lycopene epsilon-cyclase